MNKKIILTIIILVVILSIVSIVIFSLKTKVGASCNSNETCQNIDCSSYDTPVKNGYEPFCVDNQCRCMCYGCE